MSEKVVAKVDGYQITQVDLDRVLKAFALQEKKKSEEIDEKEKRSLLDRLIQNRLLFVEGGKRKLTVEDAEIERELAGYYSRFGGKGKFQELLSKEGVTLEKFSADLHKDLLIHKTIDSQIEAKATVSDAEIKEYYEKNKEKMVIPEKVGASHILFGTQNCSEEEAKSKAEKVLSQIKNGAGFLEKAREHSDCPSKEKGGSLGTFAKGQMVPEFEKVVFEMEVGQISDPVKTQFGYHIIKKDSQTAMQKLDLESVRAYILKELKMAQGKKIVDALTEDLRAKSKIEYL